MAKTKFAERPAPGRPRPTGRPVASARGGGLGAVLGRPGGGLALPSRDAKKCDFGGKTAQKTPNRRGNQRNLAMGTQMEVDQQV